MKGLVVAKKKASAKKANVKKKVTVKKANTTKTVSKKTVKKKPAAKKAEKKIAAKKSVTKKSMAKKPVAKKVLAKKTVVKKAIGKKPTEKKSTVVSAATQTSSKPKAAKVDFSSLLTPLDDRLVVRLSGAEKMTAGGLYIPDTVSDVSGNLEGVVVAIGRGHMNKKGHVRLMDVKAGDRVVFSEYAGSKVKLHNEDLVILRESEVLGVVSK